MRSQLDKQNGIIVQLQDSYGNLFKDCENRWQSVKMPFETADQFGIHLPMHIADDNNQQDDQNGETDDKNHNSHLQAHLKGQKQKVMVEQVVKELGEQHWLHEVLHSKMR